MPFYWTPESLQANSIIPKSCFVFFNSGGVVGGGAACGIAFYLQVRSRRFGVRWEPFGACKTNIDSIIFGTRLYANAAE